MLRVSGSELILHFTDDKKRMKLLHCLKSALCGPVGRVHFSPSLARQSSSSVYPSPELRLPPPCLDWEFITNPDNFQTIAQNIALRHSKADIARVRELYSELQRAGSTEAERADLDTAARALPNMCAARVPDLGDTPHTVAELSWTQPQHFKPKVTIRHITSLSSPWPPLDRM